jgi:hypothetical protein
MRNVLCRYDTAAAMDLRPGGLWGFAGRAFDIVMGRPEAVFVPTGSMALLEALHAALPRHRLVGRRISPLYYLHRIFFCDVKYIWSKSQLRLMTTLVCGPCT